MVLAFRQHLLCALKSYAKLSKRVQSAKQKTKFLGLPMPSAAKLM